MKRSRRPTDDEQDAHIDRLGKLVGEGSVTLLVGAGSSIACGYPGWLEFLDALEARLVDQLHPDYLRSLRDRDPRTRADELAKHLGDDFAQALRQIFGPTSEPLTLPRWCTALFDLKWRLLVTTNYSVELEHAAQALPTNPFGPAPIPVRWHDDAGFDHALRRLGGCPELVYLHGRYDDPVDRIILGERSYRAAYESPGLLQQRLSAICQTGTLLIVGSSLRDDDMMGVLRFTKALAQDRAPHYALIGLRKDDDMTTVRSELLDRYGVQPIFYAISAARGRENHEGLHALLRSIADRAPASARSTTVSVPDPKQAIPPGEYVRLHRRARSALDHLDILARQFTWESMAARGRELRDVLQDDLYRVAIAGRSRAGKSTILNALVGRKLCPTQKELTTAVPIAIAPGDPESALVRYEDGRTVRLDGPIAADVLAPYADQANNPDNLKRISQLDVHLTDDVLDLGVSYVDIPGYDDPSDRIWPASERVLDEAHAVILVMDVSTVADGGWALDRETKTFLEGAIRRRCNLFVVCNKADRLEASERRAALERVESALARFEFTGSLAAQPFLLSAEDAVSRQERSLHGPPEFERFQDALWRALWKVESIGLRRLGRVLDQLQIAADEVATLIALRVSKEPDRQKLRGAWTTCHRDLTTLTSEAALSVEKVRTVAAQVVARQRAAIAAQVASYVTALPDATNMPRPSSVAQALSAPVLEGLTTSLNDVQKLLSASVSPFESRLVDSLGQLRSTIGSVLNLRDAARIDGQSLSHRVTVPAVGDLHRRTEMLAAGGISATATTGIVSLLGGPISWALLAGIGMGSLVTWLASVITDRAATRPQLQLKVSAKLDEIAAQFGRQLDGALVEAGSAVSQRIRSRMQPYLDDVLHRLEDIRPPTPEESAVHAAMSKEIAETRDSLKAIFDAASRDSD